jgi:hypothetical protein
LNEEIRKAEWRASFPVFLLSSFKKFSRDWKPRMSVFPSLGKSHGTFSKAWKNIAMDRWGFSKYWKPVLLIFQDLELFRCGIFNAKAQSSAEGAEPVVFFAASVCLCVFALNQTSSTPILHHSITPFFPSGGLS